MSQRSSLSLFLSILLLTGCGQATSSSQKPEDLIYDTPEECYAAMQYAGESKSVPVLLSCFATPERNQQVGMIAHLVEREAIFQTPKKDAALALLKKNNLENADIMGLMQMYSMPGGEGVNKAVEMVGARVTNQVQFMEEAAALLNPEGTKPGADPQPQQTLPKLENLKVEGDFATADVTDPATMKTETIFFIQENGSWVITSGKPRPKTP